MSRVGFRRLIHGKITTLPADRGTPGRRDGLSKATFSQNGYLLNGVRFSGFMANVRYHPARMFYSD
jgi:hypothetical protein